MENRIKNLRFAVNVLEQLQAEGPYDYSKEIAEANERLNDLINQSSPSSQKTDTDTPPVKKRRPRLDPSQSKNL